MIDANILQAILDSLKNEVICFVDTEHLIRYMNLAATKYYDGGASLIGTSIFNCHNEDSKKKLLELVDRLVAGENEIFFSQNENTQFYLRAVRDSEGNLVGYYEHILEQLNT